MHIKAGKKVSSIFYAPICPFCVISFKPISSEAKAYPCSTLYCSGQVMYTELTIYIYIEDHISGTECVKGSSSYRMVLFASLNYEITMK